MNTPIFAIPGNHDYHFKSYNELSLTYESYSAFEVNHYIAFLCLESVRPELNDESASILSHRTKAFQAERPKTIYFPALERIGTTNVLLLMLNSNRREGSNPLTNAIGFIGSEQFEEAESLIKSNRKEGDFLILAVHHHVFLPSGKLSFLYLQCADAKDILPFAERNNVNLIAHGHIHLPIIIEHKRKDGRGIIPVLSCGSLHHPSTGDCTKEASAYMVSVQRNGGVAATIII